MFEDGEDVIAPCRTCGTVLQAAAAEGKTELIDLLLRKKAEANGHGG